MLQYFMKDQILLTKVCVWSLNDPVAGELNEDVEASIKQYQN